MIDTSIFEELVALYDREAHADDLARAAEQHEQLLALFPRDGWPEMTLKRYALGQPNQPENFCRWMEFVAKDLGSIRGGNAKKLLIYFQPAAASWWYDQGLYDSVDTAWAAVRSGFLEAFGYAEAKEFERADTIGALRSGPALLNKSLYVYFPDDVLPINSHNHLRHFLLGLGEPRADDGSLGTVALNQLLLVGIRATGLVDGWSTKEIERLLYDSRLDPFKAIFGAGPVSNPGAFIRESLARASDERVIARRNGEDAARKLLDDKAGTMVEADLRTLCEFVSADYSPSAGKPTSGRFSPAFQTPQINDLLKDLQSVNEFTGKIWRSSVDEAAEAAFAVLDDRSLVWGGGSSYPSMLLYLRDPERWAVWIKSTDVGLSRLADYVPSGGLRKAGSAGFEAFSAHAAQLMDSYDIPPQLLDWVLWEAARVKSETVKPTSRSWIFQANPKVYDIDSAVANLDELVWVVRQSKADIHVGDAVYLWRSGDEAGVIALASILTEPAEMEVDESEPYILDHDALGKTELRVRLKIDDVLDPLISRTTLLENPELATLGVIKQAQGTNYPVSPQQDLALRALIDGAVPVDGEVQLPAVSDEAAEKLYIDRDWLQDEIVDLLAEKRQLVFYGPPGTGKTLVAQRIAEMITRDGGSHELIQFHPSYSYEDFFEGYRPIETDGGMGVTYKLTGGPLRRIAARAETDSSHPHVLIIDEINRGNVPKIFGELLFLLEYRGARIPLQYSPELLFGLPKNVFVIATMNTADRSIALVDAALRRRFYFVPFMPGESPVRDVLEKWLLDHELDLEPALLLRKLNARIANDEIAIGPSYFITQDGKAPNLDTIWRHALEPLLEEHYYGSGRDVGAEFGLKAIRQALKGDQAPPPAAGQTEPPSPTS